MTDAARSRPIKPAEACQDMGEVRAEIDRIDAALVDLLAERFSYVDRAWQLKENPADAVVPWRIEEVVNRVEARTAAAGLPTGFGEALWREMIDWFIKHEQAHLQARNDQGDRSQDHSGAGK